ncbi:unnamed protein product [Adineta ricciae]|uniref:Uncharacterized protein n=1 Tax=Adineta ricciae TaxID=249248 RepID=A0A815VJP3_ADIRI|nr:unnamed protein product [Adineta ricciae]
MNCQYFLVILLWIIIEVYSFGENGSGIRHLDFTTPSAVYPVYKSAKSQGLLRVHILRRTTTLSTNETTSISPSFDDLLEKYLEKKGKDKFANWYGDRTNGHIMNSSSFLVLLLIFLTFLYLTIFK